MIALIKTIDLALNLYWWIIIGSAVFSWLYAFNVVNPRNQFVGAIGNMLFRLTEPALRPIRRFLPDLGGIDISPIILLLIIFFIREFLWSTVAPLARVTALTVGFCFKTRPDGLDLFVRLTPRSSTDAIEGIGEASDGNVHLVARVRAVPEKGAANAALEKLIANWLGIPKSSARVVSGSTARLKTVRLTGDADTLAASVSSALRLEAAAKPR